MNTKEMNLLLIILLILSIVISACLMPLKGPVSTEGSDNQVDSVDPIDPIEDIEPTIQVQAKTATPEQSEAILIQDFISARDYLVAYLSEKYGIESPDPWIEGDITSADAEGLTAFRYVSGPLWIEISAEASAPYPTSYTFQEVSNIANGFRWEGTLAFDGTIVETMVVPPWQVLDTEQARDTVLAYLGEVLEVAAPENWVDDGSSSTENITVVHSYSSGSWVVTVEFAPAAPLVLSYTVVVKNASKGIYWEGEISGQGDISVIRNSK